MLSCKILVNNKLILPAPAYQTKKLGSTEEKVLDFYRKWSSGHTDFEISTSGSTGIPKKIILNRELMIASAEMTAKALGLKGGDRSFSALNTDYIGGMMMLVRALSIPLETYIYTPSGNPFELMEIEEGIHFDFFSFAPLQVFNILTHSKKKIPLLNKAKAIIVGGGVISPELERLIQGIESPVYQTFGMTETLSHIALKRVNGQKKMEYFKILEGVIISTDDRNCLKIKAPSTGMREIITNDLVEIIDDQHFDWIGRWDHVINSGGIKIQTEQLEKTIAEILYRLNLKREFYIKPENDTKLGEKVVLLIEGKPINTALEQEFLKQLRQAVGAYRVPKSIRYREHFQRSESGKILRKGREDQD